MLKVCGSQSEFVLLIIGLLIINYQKVGGF